MTIVDPFGHRISDQIRRHKPNCCRIIITGLKEPGLITMRDHIWKRRCPPAAVGTCQADPFISVQSSVPSPKPPRLLCWLMRPIEIRGTKRAVDCPGEAGRAQRRAITAEAGILRIPDATLASGAPRCTAA